MNTNKLSSIIKLNKIQILCVNISNILEIWNIPKGYLEKSITIGSEHLNFYRGGIRLNKTQILIGGDHDLNIFQLPNFDILKSLKGHRHNLISIAKINKSQIVSGSLNKRIKIWDIVTGKCLKTLKNDERVFSIIKLNKYQIVSQCSTSIKIWDI